jgi:hypothetical protein
VYSIISVVLLSTAISCVARLYCFFLGVNQALKTCIQSEIIKSFCQFRDSVIKVKLDHESTGHRLLKPTFLTHAEIRD